MAIKVVMKIGEGGKVSYVDREALQFMERLGGKTRKRASHVEPTNGALRILFHALRKVVSDESRAAAFTRRWPCEWRARLLEDGTVLGPFRDRQEAIEAEIEWLER